MVFVAFDSHGHLTNLENLYHLLRYRHLTNSFSRIVQDCQNLLPVWKVTTENELKPKWKICFLEFHRKSTRLNYKDSMCGGKSDKIFCFRVSIYHEMTCLPLETVFHRNCKTTCKKEKEAWLFHYTNISYHSCNSYCIFLHIWLLNQPRETR